MNDFSLSRQGLTILILRLSVACIFIFIAIFSYLHPFEWISYFPDSVRIFPDSVVLNIFGLIEIIIAGWLIWGKKIFIPSLAAFLFLFINLFSNLDQFEDLFRSISSIGAALVLTILSYPRIIPKNKL